jgi:tRNA threonylcarbamoyladenosine biosynthesis protein TsaB
VSIRLNIEALGVALGPGSFTSLRIGLSIVKGLALALRIPIVGVPTLEFLTAAQPIQEIPLAAVLTAGRNRLAVGWYAAGKQSWESQGEPKVTTAAEALFEQIEEPTLVCGELTAAERQILARKRRIIILASPAISLRRPSFLAEIAWKRWRSGKTDDAISLAPIYLQTVETTSAWTEANLVEKLIIRKMALKDVPRVREIDVASFSLPWPERSFRFEITDKPCLPFMGSRDH